MKFIFIFMIAIAFNLSAQAQEVETPGKPVDEMTLVGNGSEKPIQVEDQNAKKKPSGKKNKKHGKSKNSDQ